MSVPLKAMTPLPFVLAPTTHENLLWLAHHRIYSTCAKRAYLALFCLAPHIHILRGGGGGAHVKKI
jgi:hypothetical protein